ncbi:MAG: hypothetical protein WCK65_08320 [Rhodospirillaceae bacterium]
MTSSVITLATTLKQVRRVVGVRPLEAGDPRYLDLSPGHGSRAMAELRRVLNAVVDDEADGVPTGDEGFRAE